MTPVVIFKGITAPQVFSPSCLYPHKMSSTPRYTTKLRGARVLIIGGSSGIGFGLAQALIEHHASVIIASSSQPRLDRAVTHLQQSAPSPTTTVHGIQCNLNNEATLRDEVADLFAQIAPLGKLDHVVHTAGDALSLGPIESFSLPEIKQAGMLRFFAPLVVAQHLRANLTPGPVASYTFTSGGLSERPRPGWVVVMAYLTGLEGMSRALARELAPLRVNVVGPGPVDTPLWDAHAEADDGAALREQLVRGMATGRFAQVEDVVEAYLYILKDRNVTGSFVKTNGGGLLM